MVQAFLQYLYFVNCTMMSIADIVVFADLPPLYNGCASKHLTQFAMSYSFPSQVSYLSIALARKGTDRWCLFQYIRCGLHHVEIKDSVLVQIHYFQIL